MTDDNFDYFDDDINATIEEALDAVQKPLEAPSTFAELEAQTAASKERLKRLSAIQVILDTPIIHETGLPETLRDLLRGYGTTPLTITATERGASTILLIEPAGGE